MVLGLVVSAGCRGCGADKAAKKKARKKVVTKEVKVGPSVSDMMAGQGPRGELAAIEMSVLTAPEPTREVAPEVAAARDLILTGDKAKGTDARSQLTEFLKTQETNPDAHYWMGRAWILERIAVPSIEQFELAIQHDATFVSPYQWAAVALHREKRCADAMVHLNKVIEMKPEDTTARVDRAVCHIALKDWQKAIADLEAHCAKNADEKFCPAVTKVKERLANAPASGKIQPRRTAEERKAFMESRGKGTTPKGAKKRPATTD
jgi:Flp pilus assembly protein TadD